MEQLRFIIAGPPRIASTWLTEVAKRLLVVPNAIKHEWFADDMLTAMDTWRSPEPVCGSIGQDHSWMHLIHAARPDTKWIFGWRDPMEQVISMLHNRWSAIGQRSPQAVPGFALKHAMREWLALDWALAKAEELKIEVAHWHFDYYTTNAGAYALMREIGNGYYIGDAELPWPSNVSQKRPLHIAPSAEKALLDLFSSMPRLCAALKAARRA